MLDVNKCRKLVVDRSQNMGPNYGDFWDVHDSPETVVGLLCGIYALNSALVFIR